MSYRPPLAGVLPVVQTPFHADETIDFATLESEIDWLFERGANGVVVAMVSEILRLSTVERQAMAEHVCHCARKRGPVVISVGAESSRVTVALARHAAQSGTDAVMAIPPIATAIGEAELHAYYQRIIDAVPIPVIVQDASGYVGRPMSIAAQAKLLEEFGPDRVYFKPEASPIGARLSQLRDATGGAARIFEGTGGIALADSYRRGIVGTMPGADLIDGIVALWKALVAGNQSRVDQLAFPIGALVALQSGLDGFLAIEKHLLVRQGVFANTIVRGPVGFHLDDETAHEAERLFDAITAVLR